MIIRQLDEVRRSQICRVGDTVRNTVHKGMAGGETLAHERRRAASPRSCRRPVGRGHERPGNPPAPAWDSSVAPRGRRGGSRPGVVGVDRPLNAWKPSHGTRASSTAGITLLRRFSGRWAVPTDVANTMSFGPGHSVLLVLLEELHDELVADRDVPPAALRLGRPEPSKDEPTGGPSGAARNRGAVRPATEARSPRRCAAPWRPARVEAHGGRDGRRGVAWRAALASAA